MSTSRSKRSERLDGSRIRLARLTRGLAKTELAARIGVTPRTIQTFESEGAPLDRVAVLEAALDYPERFFLRSPLNPLDEDQARFRARRRATAAQRSAARADGAIAVELYEWIADRFRLPEVDLLDLDGEPPEGAAAALRSAWGQGAGPLPNLVQLAEAHGIRVLSLPGRSALVDAFAVWRDGHPYVFLSTMKTTERSRFDLAHEIGHLVLHSRGHADGVEAEREADRFAAAFLMPTESLLPLVGREPAVPRVLELRSHYGVSAFAMAHRLHALGRLSDWAYRQDCVHLTQRGYRTGEPGGLPRERSRVFSVVLSTLARQGTGPAEIADELGLDVCTLHDLVFGQFVMGLGRNDEEHRRSIGTADVESPPKLRLV